jgi:plasmid maintenance system antidote protein VapI
MEDKTPLRDTIGGALLRHMTQNGQTVRKVRLAVSRALDISIPHLEALLRNRADVDEDMAKRLGKHFGTGADYWAELQRQRGPAKPYLPKSQAIEPGQPAPGNPALLVPRPADAPAPVNAEPLQISENPEAWPHARYAWAFLRGERWVEVDPNLLMAAYEHKPDDPATKDILRRFSVIYVEFFATGTAKIWLGKRVTFQRSGPRRSWTLHSVERLYETRYPDSEIWDTAQQVWFSRFCDRELGVC